PVVGGRQGWDQTGVQLGSANGTLGNSQTETTLRWETIGDAYVPTFYALEALADDGRCLPIFKDRFELP
ncbi:MAG: hypothetical protein AAGJ52_13830, partial [Pseudomonadota bacterium]